MYTRTNWKIYDPTISVDSAVERELDLALTHAPIQLCGSESDSFAVFKLKGNQPDEQAQLAGIFGNSRIGVSEAAPITAPLIYLYCRIVHNYKTNHHWQHIGICSGMQLERANALEQPASMIGCKFQVNTPETIQSFTRWLNQKFHPLHTRKSLEPILALCVGTPSSETLYGWKKKDIQLKNGTVVKTKNVINTKGDRPRYYL